MEKFTDNQNQLYNNIVNQLMLHTSIDVEKVIDIAETIVEQSSHIIKNPHSSFEDFQRGFIITGGSPRSGKTDGILRALEHAIGIGVDVVAHDDQGRITSCRLKEASIIDSHGDMFSKDAIIDISNLKLGQRLDHESVNSIRHSMGMKPLEQSLEDDDSILKDYPKSKSQYHK